MNEIDQAFANFETTLRTPQGETTAARNHRASVEQCLEEKFGTISFFQSGSFGNGTNIPVHSDVDRFAVFPATEIHKDSRVTLRRLRVALAKRFPRTLSIRIRPPGVTVPFGTDGLELTEIIPAQHIGKKNDCRVFLIPSPSNNGWIAAAPESHRQYVTDVDGEQDGRIKPLIRFLKAWKYEHMVPIQSIYLELFVADFAGTMGLVSPSIDIARILNFIKTEKLPAIRDPLDISGTITVAATGSDRGKVLLKLPRFSKLATNAATAEIEWRFPVALQLWKRFFKGKFSST